MPPSPFVRWLRLKPVAIFWESVALGNRSPASLFHGELVIGHVAIEGVEHPIAPAPHFARTIGLISIGVAIARRFHPAESHALGVAGRRKQAVDDLFVSGG